MMTTLPFLFALLCLSTHAKTNSVLRILKTVEPDILTPSELRCNSPAAGLVVSMIRHQLKELNLSDQNCVLRESAHIQRDETVRTPFVCNKMHTELLVEIIRHQLLHFERDVQDCILRQAAQLGGDSSSDESG